MLISSPEQLGFDFLLEKWHNCVAIQGAEMYSSSDFETIKDIVIAAVPSVESIFLFGSYAKGTAREQSDIDIAVLLEQELGWRERNSILNRLYGDAAQKGYNVDFLLKRADKFRDDSSLPTMSRVILREGRLLWTKN
jgi:predicted nucleotidyltransferase